MTSSQNISIKLKSGLFQIYTNAYINLSDSWVEITYSDYKKKIIYNRDEISSIEIKNGD